MLLRPETINAYRKLLGQLQVEREEIDRQILRTQAAIAAAEEAIQNGSVERMAAALNELPQRAGPGLKRRNELSLRAAIAKVTTGAPKTKDEILEAVVALGYRFKSKVPLIYLNQTLYTSKDPRFKNENGRLSPA